MGNKQSTVENGCIQELNRIKIISTYCLYPFSCLLCY